MERTSRHKTEPMVVSRNAPSDRSLTPGKRSRAEKDRFSLRAMEETDFKRHLLHYDNGG